MSQLADIERPTLFDYEMTLDLYYFAQMWKDRSKVVTKRDLEELTAAWGSKFDMLNLQWIYRSKRYYHMTSAQIYALLIPVHHRLKKDVVKALVEAENMSAFPSCWNKPIMRNGMIPSRSIRWNPCMQPL